MSEPRKPGQPIFERFARLGEEHSFDIQFWQSQPESTIFEAAHDMVLQYLLVTTGSADAPRLDRTVESFQHF